MGHRRTRIRLVGVLVVASATMASGRSQADPVTLGASLAGIASGAGEVIGYLQKGYSAYKFLDGLFNPQPSTAELIQAAVTELKEFIAETSLNDIWYPRANTVSTLLSIAEQTNTDDAWQDFQTEATNYLHDVEGKIRESSGARMAHALAGIYNIYMPVLMAVHLNGAQHKLLLLPQPHAIGNTYAEQVYNLAKRLIQLDYELVGLKSTIRQSPL